MRSIWTETCQIEPRAALRGDLRCEVAVIGAGMAGILIADKLHQAGHQVVVLEANRIAGGQTSGTTAKITSQHGLKYSSLLSEVGEEKARLYAEANEAAIREFRRIADRRKIDCDLEICANYVYGDDTRALRQEAHAAALLGLPARYVTQPEAPFACAGAVRFTDQAQFHPLKFLRAVSAGLTVYEQTPVLSVKGRVLEIPGGRVTAEKLIFACHYPFLRLAGLYAARLHQERSYVLALENAPQIDSMWIGTGSGLRSLRRYGELLLLGGEGHRTGENSAGGAYEALRKTAAALFPGSREVLRWSAQDCMTADGVPLIGRYDLWHPDWFVATGFRKWGMTSSMLAATLLRELVEGREPPEAAVFDPSRFRAGALVGLAQDGGHAVKGLTRSLLGRPDAAAEAILPGHGGIARWKGKTVGLFREPDGTVHLVSVRCPHLGCRLEWNPDERSWDCPCHGSRFDFRGKRLSGPALPDITLIDRPPSIS